jgi:hypothetical protein
MAQQNYGGQDGSAKLEKSADNLRVSLGPGVAVDVDLSQHNLDAEQHRILEKAVSALNSAGTDSKTLVASGCPAQPHLAPEEFQRIQGLKATLSATGGGEATAGLIADFCLHVVSV